MVSCCCQVVDLYLTFFCHLVDTLKNPEVVNTGQTFFRDVLQQVVGSEAK
jgi:hypothetical protein